MSRPFLDEDAINDSFRGVVGGRSSHPAFAAVAKDGFQIVNCVRVMIQTNQIKSDAFYEGVQAELLQSVQLAREAAFKQRGAQEALAPIRW